jgi:hypothetical protein
VFVCGNEIEMFFERDLTQHRRVGGPADRRQIVGIVFSHF